MKTALERWSRLVFRIFAIAVAALFFVLVYRDQYRSGSAHLNPSDERDLRFNKKIDLFIKNEQARETQHKS